MNLLKPKKLEDVIVNSLVKGEKSTTFLLTEARSSGNNPTKQGFYQALRNLKRDEVILIYKKMVSLDPVWMSKMREMIENISKNYAVNESSFDVLGLEDKESITYSFSNIKNLDAFWGHLQSVLMHNTNKKEPIFSYDPHYWFYIARKEREKELLKEIVQNNRQFLMTVGGSTELDKMIKSEFNTDYLQYNRKRMFFKENYYTTVIGDYITEVHLDEKVAQKIEKLYQTSTEINNAVINELKLLLNSKTKNKLKVSRNKTKAEKLKKKFSKDFYVIR